MKETPLHRDAMALCGVLLEDLGEAGAAVLRQRLVSSALAVLEDVTLAVAGRDRRQRLEDADAGLQLFRTHLRLARELGLLDEEGFLEYAGQADVVGRQMGGWLKSLRRGRE
ncbi:MAG: four helix bundle protein [Thermoanaerobaculia bacterium]